VSSGYVEEIGWAPDTTSSIVRCQKCGSIYTRDVFTGYERAKANNPLEIVIILNNIKISWITTIKK
jgi:hypothetical protein